MPTISGLLGAGSCALRPELRGYNRRSLTTHRDLRSLKGFVQTRGRALNPAWRMGGGPGPHSKARLCCFAFLGAVGGQEAKGMLGLK